MEVIEQCQVKILSRLANLESLDVNICRAGVDIRENTKISFQENLPYYELN